MKQSILMLRPTTESELAEFSTLYNMFYCPKTKGLENLTREQIQSIRGVVTNASAGIKNEIIDMLPALEIISFLSAGYESIDIEYARSKKLTVTHGRGTNDFSVADHAMAIMLCLARDIVACDRATRADQMEKFKTTYERPLIYKKRLGIYGLGSIGKQIARRALGFEMSISYYNRTKNSDVNYKYFSSLLELAKNSDWLVVACPGGDSTFHTVNAEVLTALGPKGYLLNIARGSVVDTNALIEVLEKKLIAGAALDVVEGEPHFPESLCKLSNVILTPHIGGKSLESNEAMVNQVLENLASHFSGKPVLTPVT